MHGHWTPKWQYYLMQPTVNHLPPSLSLTLPPSFPPSLPPRFDQAFSLMLEQLQPVCVSEQKFCTCFFHFKKPGPPADPEMADQTDGMDEEEREVRREGEEERGEGGEGRERRRLQQTCNLGHRFPGFLPRLKVWASLGMRLADTSF